MLPHSPTKELFVWLKTFCPGCEYNQVCDQKGAQIRDCVDEDKFTIIEEPIEHLIRRTIRFSLFHARDKFSRVGKGFRPIKLNVINNPSPTLRHAYLSCSHPEEYYNCR